uniref:JmjC domain-containing protein n=1 Tax=Palpitomonas bilix TaxID=652834 RepID=A0A7S3D969_9EUKA|mmetsp:Transcript_27562/g.70567  ORF Transcript_27562/g.70567 Transcript_27562/m.70567 type:complete len:182 (+) Transcript_27562:92-637(+)
MRAEKEAELTGRNKTDEYLRSQQLLNRTAIGGEEAHLFFGQVMEPGPGCLFPTVSSYSLRPIGLMFGTKGSRSSMHRDFSSNVMIFQGEGVKEIALFPHEKRDMICKTSTNYKRIECPNVLDSEDGVDKLSGEAKRWLLRGAIHPGDVLYLPQGWLHETFCTSDCTGMIERLNFLVGHHDK